MEEHDVNDKGLQPGETFQLIGAEVLSKEHMEHKLEPIDWANGTITTLNYDLYKVKARVSKFFDVGRFPRDNHMMTVKVEDRVHDHHELQYVADEDESSISSRVKVHGYATAGMGVTVKWHAYKSARGDPFTAAFNNPTSNTEQINHSQFVVGIPIIRPNWGL